MNPHLVRTAVVTYFQAKATTYCELEGLALCMGHSMDVQGSIYDQRGLVRSFSREILGCVYQFTTSLERGK